MRRGVSNYLQPNCLFNSLPSGTRLISYAAVDSSNKESSSSGWHQRKYQSYTCMYYWPFVKGNHRSRWFPFIKGRWCGKRSHAMTSTVIEAAPQLVVNGGLYPGDVSYGNSIQETNGLVITGWWEHRISWFFFCHYYFLHMFHVFLFRCLPVEAMHQNDSTSKINSPFLVMPVIVFK